MATGGEAVCFGREASVACRATSERPTNASLALLECFGGAPATSAERVRLATLSSGDLVVTLDAATSEPSFERVLLTQHKRSSAWTTLMRIEAERAVLTVTPDHAIWIDGALVAAREAAPGRLLTGARGEKLAITRVEQVQGGIINPITASGTLLVGDVDGGEPVLASTHPTNAAPFFVHTGIFDFSFSRLLAYALPASAQACYSALEPILLDTALAPFLNASGLGLGSPGLVGSSLFLAADALFALLCAGVSLFTLKSVATLGVAALTGVAVAKKA